MNWQWLKSLLCYLVLYLAVGYAVGILGVTVYEISRRFTGCGPDWQIPRVLIPADERGEKCLW